jgi:sedoheptulose-bisphosphatase
LFGSRVGEDTLSLGELLVDIRDKTSGVSKSVSVVHEVVNELLVSWNILCSTKIGRREDLGIFADLDLVLGADPRFPGSVRKLASFRGASIGEFVGTIVKGNQDSGTGSVKGNKRGDLVTSLGSQKTSGLGPDSHHGTNGPVVVNNGEFTVCWDPLDGSSIVDNNWAVGTMMGIWPKSTGLLGAKGSDQVTSLVALYGPRTTVLVALDDGAYEFSYGCTPEGCQLPDGTWEPWICSKNKVQISEDAKIFSPANLRATQDVPGYKKLVDHFMDNRYTLRYSGGLVPDVYQQFTKGQGVFSNPTSEQSPAKLRLAFEAAPFGLLVEKAGGLTSDGVTGNSILDVEITGVDQRTALCLGSANEVKRFNEYLEL